MGKEQLLILTGFSASGKDTLMEKLLEANLGYDRVVTHTSRPIRPGEVHGRDYHFVSRQEFEDKLTRGEFLEYVDYAGDYKGTHKEAVLEVLKGKALIWRIDMSRAAIVHNTFKEVFDEETASAIIAKTKVVLLTVSDPEHLKKRMLKRDRERFSKRNFLERMAKDLEVFKKYSFQHIIYNEEERLEEAFKELLGIIEGKS